MTISTKNNQVQFDEGTGLVLEDLHDMQHFTRSHMDDQGLGAFGGTEPTDNYPVAAMTGYALCPRAGHGYLTATANPREVTNTPGYLWQWTASGAPDGLTPKLLRYPLAAGDLLTAFAANVSGNPRIDALCVKLSEVDGQDIQSRDFEDAITHVVTTSTGPTKRRVQLDVAVATGTPGATPALPAPPAGYAVYAYACIANGFAGVMTYDLIMDNRMPSRIHVSRVFAPGLINFNGAWVLSTNRLYAQNTGVTGTDTVDLPCPVGADARIIRCSIFGNFGGRLQAGVGGARLERMNMADGTVATPFAAGMGFSNLMEDPGGIYSTSLLSRVNAETSVASPVHWGNGYPAGMGAYAQGSYAFNAKALLARLADDNTHTQLVSMVEWVYAI